MLKRMSRKQAGGIIAALVLIGSATAAQTLTIGQKNRQFDRDKVSIVAGDTLRFTNEDDFLHQIYASSPGMNFDSDEQAPGDIVDVKFPTPGEFDVRCGIHPRMRLHVSVSKAAAAKR